jgi:hypothetical protein
LHEVHTCSVVAMPKATGQLARVGVSPETWQAFRQVAVVRGISLSRYLGELVEAELHRRRGTPVEHVSVEMPEPDQALAALAQVRRSINELDQIAGRLARSALRHGGSWSDVGSSLQLAAQAARRAYERPRE